MTRAAFSFIGTEIAAVRTFTTMKQRRLHSLLVQIAAGEAKHPSATFPSEGYSPCIYPHFAILHGAYSSSDCSSLQVIIIWVSIKELQQDRPSSLQLSGQGLVLPHVCNCGHLLLVWPDANNKLDHVHELPCPLFVTIPPYRVLISPDIIPQMVPVPQLQGMRPPSLCPLI